MSKRCAVNGNHTTEKYAAECPLLGRRRAERIAAWQEVKRAKRSRNRRTNPLAVLATTLDRITGDGHCAAIVLHGIGLGMTCSRPCEKCRALRAEVARLQPQWEATRAAYMAEHPNARPKPTAAEEEDDPWNK